MSNPALVATADVSQRAPSISVVVPVHDPHAGDLTRLGRSLKLQSFRSFELVVVDDASPNAISADLADLPARRIVLTRRSGPAVARNTGVAASRGRILFFTDSDCWLDPETLASVNRWCRYGVLVAGNTVTDARSRVGQAVALLGFPGGGSLGFPKVWKVDEQGFTDSFSGCNFAITRRDFRVLGGFDPSFPVAGGEDTVLAKTAVRSGLRIRYVPEVCVHHRERGNVGQFVRWQLRRGRGSYHICRTLDTVAPFARLRLRSFGNSLRAASGPMKPAVLVLILTAVAAQTLGCLVEHIRTRRGNAVSAQLPLSPPSASRAFRL